MKAKRDTDSQSSRPEFGKIPDLPDNFKTFPEFLTTQFGGILPLVYIPAYDAMRTNFLIDRWVWEEKLDAHKEIKLLSTI